MSSFAALVRGGTPSTPSKRDASTGRSGRRDDAGPRWARPRLEARDEGSGAYVRLGANVALQRKGKEGLRKEGLQDEEEHPLLRKEDTGGREPAGAVPGIVGDVVASGRGRPLDARMRDYFEPRLGHDLGDVRVHVGADANASAHAVGAHAYTVGRDIVFRDGAFAPEAPSGKGLLAHELAHVAQQKLGTAPTGGGVVPAHDGSERDADRFAAEVVREPHAGAARLTRT